MVVLSLFDGMSCGQIALTELGINIEKYYASEIDKFAIAQTQLNFPNTIQLGDITKWRDWDIDWKIIDLILAGSPCQGFSFAGKQLAFDDPRSKLFFVFIEILNHCKKFNTDVKFLLENVNMKKDYLRIISEYVGVFPVNINSNLVSAQNRDRWYWTNIKTKKVGLFDEVYTDIPQPKDQGVLLRDILEAEVDEKYFLSDKALAGMENHKKRHEENHNGFGFSILDNESKSNTILSRYYKDGKEALVMTKNYLQNNGNSSFSQANRYYYEESKSPILGIGHAMANPQILQNDSRIRRLTPLECSRLQTIPAWYKWECFDTQIYKMIGNGWTCKVIEHILSFYENK